TWFPRRRPPPLSNDLERVAVVRTFRSAASGRSEEPARHQFCNALSVVDDDVLNQRLQELDAFEHVSLFSGRIERHLRFQRAEELLCMGDVTDAMHVGVFRLR